jgi:hypothetical protein
MYLAVLDEYRKSVLNAVRKGCSRVDLIRRNASAMQSVAAAAATPAHGGGGPAAAARNMFGYQIRHEKPEGGEGRGEAEQEADGGCKICRV